MRNHANEWTISSRTRLRYRGINCPALNAMRRASESSNRNNFMPINSRAYPLLRVLTRCIYRINVTPQISPKAQRSPLRRVILHWLGTPVGFTFTRASRRRSPRYSHVMALPGYSTLRFSYSTIKVDPSRDLLNFQSFRTQILRQ